MPLPPARADFNELEKHFDKWEVIKDVIDQQIDIMLNYRQSGHPGGSRSKVHCMVSLLMGIMRWDIRAPEKRFADKFVMVSGHVTPVLYGTLAVLGSAVEAKHKRTPDPRYAIDWKRQIRVEDLKGFRRRHGLPGHCEMAHNTHFVKANTGPSGHGSPPAAGEAMALKHARAEGVRVFAMEGEGGMTTGATHETKNTAFGLGLGNFCYLLDWNDFGIDDHAYSSIVHGTPDEWFAPYGFNIFGAHDGMSWGSMAEAMTEMANHPNEENRPNVVWFKTVKGRGYGIRDYASHGAPHKTNSEIYWETKRQFQEKYGVQFRNFGKGAPESPEELQAEWDEQIKVAMDVIRNDAGISDYIADRLIAVGDSVPQDFDDFKLKPTAAAKSGGPRTPFEDPEFTNFEAYPEKIYAKPGDKQPNRAALASWGSYINSWSQAKYGRPAFLVCSADLAGSTNIAGFAKDWSPERKNVGKYDRNKNPDGALLPQPITEFTNSGLVCGIACVNMSEKPWEYFDGYYGACSTYGSFSYLKYGPMRLFSQTVQDSDIKLGKVIWVAGHSGPETADDSRTHFGIFAPAVTQLFPEGHVIDLHPYDYNDAIVLIAAALKQKAPIIALHMTRPPVKIADRKALGMAHYFEAAKGAYLIRDYTPGKPKQGCIFVQGTMSTQAVVDALPEITKRGWNIKVVAAVSPQLFALQSEAVRNSIVDTGDWADSMCITNRARRLMNHWIKTDVSLEYSMGSDFDDMWRTGGTLEDVLDEAHLTVPYILDGIGKFIADRDKRLARLKGWVDAMTAHA